MPGERPQTWYYVISASGALAWIPAAEPGVAPGWLDGECWHGTVVAASLADAQQQVEALRRIKRAGWLRAAPQVA